MIQDFFDNQIIKYLAPRPYWTVNIENKKPLDIMEYDRTKKIRGAANDDALTDLNNLLRIINAVPEQYVYKLNAVRDRIVILDIEKTCPDEIKAELLKLPFMYGDISVSGKGYHLIFPLPDIDQIIANKTVMREEHGYYEILINHNVTFTNNTIFPQYDLANAPIQFTEIWNELKASQKIALKYDFDLDGDDVNLDFPQYNMLKDAVIRNFKQRFKKTPSDFYGDMSRYEFAVIGSVRYSLITMLDLPIFARNITLDKRQQIMFVYNIITEILEPRPKHQERRDGKPLLLYQTYNSFVTNYKD